MIISVASGKGGTGKTTLSVALAQSIRAGICLADCDVEEPNACFLLHPKIKKRKPVFVKKPVLDEKKCTGCRKCLEVCRFNAISFIDDKPVFFEHLCHSCGGCIFKCPENAIKEKNVAIGKIEFGRKDDINFVAGTLNVGQAISPPLIKEVLRQTQKYKNVIVDAPPGTSCPMVEAVKDSDYCLLVTEPTPFGLHDLKLAIEVLDNLKKKFSVIINKSDISGDELKKFCIDRNIPIAMEIPFDRKVAESYSEGLSLAETNKDYKPKFKKLFEDISNETNSSVKR